MINSPRCSTLTAPVSHAAQSDLLAKQSPLFSGKPSKDSASFKLHGVRKTKASSNGSFLKKMLMGALLLGSGAAGVAARPTVNTPSRNYTDAFSPQYANTVNSLVPGLTTDQALTMLGRPPYKPTDKSLFSSVLYGDKKALPAANRTITDAEVKAKLQDTLKARFGKKDPRVAQGMALFADPKLIERAPDARLRGAIVNLLGTPGEPAIQAYQDPNIFLNFKFEDLDPGFHARVVNFSNETLPRVQYNGRYQFEDFRLLSAGTAHEALHQDLYKSEAEEALAHSMDTLIHGGMILENPSLIKNNTEMTQRLNTKLMARLNDRDKAGNLRLLTSQGNLYPDSEQPLQRFIDAFNDDGATPGTIYGPSSPGNSVLSGMLKKITGQPSEQASFDNTTIALLDKGEKPLTPVDLVALAKVLKLDTGAIPKANKPTKPAVEPAPAPANEPAAEPAPAPTNEAAGEPGPAPANGAAEEPTSAVSSQPAPAPQTSGARRSLKFLWF